MKGLDANEMEEKVGGIWSEIYQLGRAPYNYVKEQIENDPHWSNMPIQKAVLQLLHSYEKNYGQTKVRNVKDRFEKKPKAYVY